MKSKSKKKAKKATSTFASWPRTQRRFYEIQDSPQGEPRTIFVDLEKLCQIEVSPGHTISPSYTARVTTNGGYKSSFFIDDKDEVERLKDAWEAYLRGR